MIGAKSEGTQFDDSQKLSLTLYQMDSFLSLYAIVEPVRPPLLNTHTPVYMDSTGWELELLPNSIHPIEIIKHKLP